MRPGLALAAAISAAMSGQPPFFDTSTSGVLEIRPTVVRSRSISNGMLRYKAGFITSCELVPRPRV